ncbi:MAG TPA: putative toxin-antitoxin system toxin component, PIN family [Nitrospirota bacterium]|nr:putative toxin-antitoxin system toxin component, PIN family [Nitrospirota bacterium]
MFNGRIVIDTNVFVSGTISPKGAPRKVLELATRGAFKVVSSLSINREILEVLHREHIYVKYGLNEKLIDDIATFLYEGTVLVEDTYTVLRVRQDADDNKFISCALEGEAAYIVSGDEHLLSIKHYRGVQIVDAKSFVKIVEVK